MKTRKVSLFLDSGAYSAWSQGKAIVLTDYIKFIKEHENEIEVYANLDVIGKPEATWKNQMIMEEAGLSPLPVFHYGEETIWLKRILDRDYDYMSLGGMVPISITKLLPWLDYLFKIYLTDRNGMPRLKVHGFGMTSLKIMLRYPWYSVDSTSWVMTGRLGSIYIPRYRNSKWIYDEQSHKIAVSNRNPNNREAGKHITTMSPMEQKILLNYIHEQGYKLGWSEFKWENQDYVLKKNEKWVSKKPSKKADKREVEMIIEPGLSNTYKLRDEINIQYFNDLEKRIPKWPWAFKIENFNKSKNPISF
jgi:hypothetical protein